MNMFEVRSRLLISTTTSRNNGALGPFRFREAAERALIALCQAGQANQGEIVPIEEPDDPAPHIGGPPPPPHRTGTFDSTAGREGDG